MSDIININTAIPLLILTFVFLLFTFENKWDKFIQNLNQKRKENATCKITHDSFLFPNGYPFKYSLLKNKKNLYFKNIKEVRINTTPPTAITKNKEVIFLIGLDTEDIEKSKFITKLKLTSPIDNWELLCEVFLDTAFNDKHKEQTLKKLAYIGFTHQEVMEIRKKIEYSMKTHTVFSLEWAYYGQIHVLKTSLLLSHKKYWWTMEIALRNNKNYS